MDLVRQTPERAEPLPEWVEEGAKVSIAKIGGTQVRTGKISVELKIGEPFELDRTEMGRPAFYTSDIIRIEERNNSQIEITTKNGSIYIISRETEA